MTRPAHDYPRPGLLMAKPCGNPACGTRWGAADRGAWRPSRLRGLCNRCYRRLIAGLAAPLACPPEPEWEPSIEEIAEACREIRRVHPREPQHSGPHIYHAPRGER